EAKLNALAFFAADCAHAEALRMLFDAGASPTATEENGRTLLHRLAIRKDAHAEDIPDGAVGEAAALLLDMKVSPLKRDDNEGMTCYHFAARGGIAEMVEEMSKRGVKLGLTDRNGDTGLHIACKYAGNAVRRIDSEKNRLDRLLKENEATAARMRESGASEEKIRAHLMGSEFTDPDRAQRELDAALRHAEGYFRTVKAFEAGGVDTGQKNNYGVSALDFAVQSGAKKIAAYLSGSLSDDGDGSAIAAGGMTLHQAAEKGDVEAVEAIAAAGADVNGLKDGREDQYGGCTPLAVAVAFLKDGAVWALLSSGADPSYKDGKGRSAAYYLPNPDLASSLNDAVYKERRVGKILNALVEAGLDPDGAVDDDGNTLLMLACKAPAGVEFRGYNMKREVLGEALRQSLDVDRANRFGETALMLAGSKDFKIMEEVQAALLERGADVSAADRNGDTALHYASRCFDKAAARAFCEMLLEFGADAGAVNNARKTALDLAVERGNESLAKLLMGRM
ncbi:MAG: ankyrin repeat domain-containing protein, partial [Methanomassiliicoccaceae archaeon]|nr:ankyrin repeat domain-containing protein [Methanomassiliicoccaceae archaeon]